MAEVVRSWLWGSACVGLWLGGLVSAGPLS